MLQFKKALGAGLQGEGYDFAEVVNRSRQEGLDKFEQGAKEALLDDAAEWGYVEELNLVESEMGVVADVFRKDETTKMVNQIEVCPRIGY